MNRIRLTRLVGPLFLTTVLPAASCGSVAENSAEDPIDQQPTPGLPTAVTPHDCSSMDATYSALAEAEFAFVGTIVSVETRANSHSVTEDEGEATGIEMPWVTFHVEQWYTLDWGATFSVWMPQFAPHVGQQLAVGGNAYRSVTGDFSGQSGEVEVCSDVSQPNGKESQWNEFFRGGVVPGVQTPEGVPDPSMIDTIERDRQAWLAIEPDSYSYVVHRYDRNNTETLCKTSPQGAQTDSDIRVVVIHGERVSATGIGTGCAANVETLPTIDRVFIEAKELAGATEFAYSIEPTSGLGIGEVSMFASDRSVEVQSRVTDIDANTFPTVVGWDAVSKETAKYRKQWNNSRFDYQIDVNPDCGRCTPHFSRAIVRNGVVEELSIRGKTVDPAGVDTDRGPVTVDDVFDVIDSNEGQGTVIAIFDTSTGIPWRLYFDPFLNAIDDELRWRISVTPLNDN